MKEQTQTRISIWLLFPIVWVIFQIVWVPGNFLCKLFEYIAYPSIYWQGQLFSFPPYWWTWILPTIFWGLIILERRIGYPLLLPSESLELGFSKLQLVFFWTLLLIGITIPPMLIYTLSWRFFQHIAPNMSLWHFYIPWLIFCLAHWFFELPPAKGACVILMNKPWQSHFRPGPKLFLNLRFLYLKPLANLIQLLKIDIAPHDSPDRRERKFRMRIGNHSPQALGNFSLRWQVVDFDKFLRRVQTEDLIYKTGNGSTLKVGTDLIELAWQVYEQAIEQVVLNLNHAQVAWQKIDIALTDGAPDEQVKLLAEKADKAELAATDDFCRKANEIAAKRLDYLGVKYELFMGWNYPERYAESLDKAVATPQIAEADGLYATKMREPYGGSIDSIGELGTRIASLVLSIMNKQHK
jgi:hypothetical protein